MLRLPGTTTLLSLSLLLAATALLVCMLRTHDRAAEAVLAQAHKYKKLLDEAEPILRNRNSRNYNATVNLVEQEYSVLRKLARVYAVIKGLEGPEVHVHNLWGWGVTVILQSMEENNREVETIGYEVTHE